MRVLSANVVLITAILTICYSGYFGLVWAQGHGKNSQRIDLKSPNSIVNMCRVLLKPYEHHPVNSLTEESGQANPSADVSQQYIEVSVGMDTLLVNRSYKAGELHEVVSSARYGAHINSNFGERLVLVPSLNDRSIPGFDGFIRNREGEVIANYSLKNILGSSPRSVELVDLVRRALKKGLHYNRALAWLLNYSMVNVTDFYSADENNLALIKKHWRMSEEAVSRRAHLGQAMHLFNIHERSHIEPRPLRIVVDLGVRGAALPFHELRYLMRDYEGYLEEITLMSPARITRFYRSAGRVRVTHY